MPRSACGAKRTSRGGRRTGRSGQPASTTTSQRRTACPLTWAAAKGRTDAIGTLIELGADPNQRGTFGGPSHGQGVTAIQLAAQSGQRDAVVALLGAGADPLITDDLHGGTALGWARVGGHEELADILP